MITDIATARQNAQYKLLNIVNNSPDYLSGKALENFKNELGSCVNAVNGECVSTGEQLTTEQINERAKLKWVQNKLCDFDECSVAKTPLEDFETGMEVVEKLKGGIISGAISVLKDGNAKEFVKKLTLAFKEGWKNKNGLGDFTTAFSSAWEKYSIDGNLGLFATSLGLNPKEQKNFMLALESAQLPNIANNTPPQGGVVITQASQAVTEPEQPPKPSPAPTQPQPVLTANNGNVVEVTQNDITPPIFNLKEYNAEIAKKGAKPRGASHS